ncbi:MAG: hypothetical protein ACI9YH_000811 [Colwellia sp.]|jgi:hypothetical protein
MERYVLQGGFVSIIFDLRNESSEWADEINSYIKSSFPDYFKTNPLIGYTEWWDNSEFDLSNGKIQHVGPMVEDGELIDVISIDPLDEDFNSSGGSQGVGQPEYMIEREDFWLNDCVTVDKLMESESITILPTGELDEHSIYIETKVRFW